MGCVGTMRGWILLLLTTISSVVVMGTMGYSITFRESRDQNIDFDTSFRGDPVRPGYWHVQGTGAHVFLFITSCLGVFFGALALLHPRTGVDTLAGTFYYFASHVVLCVFYLSGSIAVLVHVGAYEVPGKDTTMCATAGGVFAIFSCLGHMATSYASRFTN